MKRILTVLFLMAVCASLGMAQTQAVQVMPCPLSLQSQYAVGTDTIAITDTSDHDVLPATSGRIWDIYNVSVYNSSTTPTFLSIYQNGSSGGTLIGYIGAPAQNPGGLVIPTGFAVRGFTANTKMTLKANDAVSTLYIKLFACKR